MKSTVTSELAVVVPTFNERDNVAPFLEALAGALEQISYEVIFVDDDSPDGTADAIREIAQRDPRVRVVHRINRRGLASACVEGMLASSAPYVAVMDADLQHDEALLPEMLERLKTKNLDVVVGSRNVAGGSMGEFAQHRVRLSMLGRRFSQSVCRCEINDPMSGFFVMTRPFLMEVVHGVSGIGFKILVDLLASCRRPVRLEEVPYRFRNRQHGESKLDILVGVEYLQLLLDKFIGDYVSPSFVLFSLVGALGVVLYLAVLWIQLSWIGVPFLQAQVVATLTAMTVNFLLNNAITYRDRRLRGWNILRGLILFYVACSFGVLINLKTAEFARGEGFPWYAAGLLGLVLSSVWNYGVTRIFTWRAIRKVRAIRQTRPATAPATAITER
ncbi:MAG TPA: glycosyltransferase family 2 protein [Bryobacteraceae bacterium]|jgi:dolichol-phosphate mannosyltransferase